MCIDISIEERPMYHRLHFTKGMKKMYSHLEIHKAFERK